MIFLICLIPFIIPFLMKLKYKNEITWPELAISCTISCLIAITVYNSSLYAEMIDVQVLSGQVNSKERKVVGCEHDYKCHCTTHTTYSNGKATTSTKCQTCYEHSYDVSWIVKSNIENFKISRIDRQGLIEPPRYTKAYIGEPVAITNSYTNYVKGAKNSLFNMNQYKDLSNLPEYPSHIYDYYKINRVIDLTGKVDTEPYNNAIAEMLKVLGSSKQVNVVLVFDKEYQNSLKLKAKFLGGKKNDIVIVVGGEDLNWVNVFSWSKNEMLNVKLKDDLMALGALNSKNFMEVVETNIKTHYVRREMKEFEYLKDSIEPSTNMVILALVLSIITSIGLSIWSVKNEL